jgi:uncharacterized protein YggU (UPF0235/DUF167 family)
MSEPATRVRLRVIPRAARTEVVGRHGAAWKLRVAAPPEAGRANAKVLEAIASAVAVPRGSVRLVAGASAPDKVVEVVGLTGDEVDARLDAAGRSGETA